MNFKLQIATAILMLTAPQNIGTKPVEREQAEVKGIVTDINGSRVPGASVEFTNPCGQFTSLTSEDGAYTLRVAPGTYKVRISKFGFCDAHRGAFSLRESSKVQFDFQLLACGTYDREGISAPSSLTRLHDRYQEEELNAPTTDAIWPLVTYGKREHRGDSVRYSGFEFQGKRHPVVYTYNLLTITADILLYSQKDNTIEGIGDVVWHDGNQTRRGSRIRISYSKGETTIELTK
jgi:hypothetical protein